MRSSGRPVLALAVALVAAVTFSACENPFDPIDQTDEIRGLSFIGSSITLDAWDPDPGLDGMVVTIDYVNEFGDTLNFHDKPHQVVIEFHKPELVNIVVEEGTIVDFDLRLPRFFGFPIEHDHSDDDIRIPFEAYEDAMVGAGYDLNCIGETGDPFPPCSAFLVIRVFPPNAVPQEEIITFGLVDEIYVPQITGEEVEEWIDESN
jgi:hypothetical protein